MINLMRISLGDFQTFEEFTKLMLKCVPALGKTADLN